MLLYHDDLLSAIHRLLCAARDDNYLLCACIDCLLCSGADGDLLRSDNCLLCRTSHIHELLSGRVRRVPDYVLRVLSALAVVVISCVDVR
jgi:hypothetical protein